MERVTGCEETVAGVVGVAPEVKERLSAFMGDVARDLGRSEQRARAGLYARGLLEAGARKSLEPIAARLGGDGDYEALQHFLADGPWDPVVIQRAVAERIAPEQAWVIDDTGVPKDGRHSPGVKRQYSGTLGKIGNCQITVSVHAVGQLGTVPLDWALYLPEDWCEDLEGLSKWRVVGLGVESLGCVPEDWRRWRCLRGSRSLRSCGRRSSR